MAQDQEAGGASRAPGRAHFFYKVEKRTKDRTKVDSCSTPATISKKDREIFVQAVKHRPRIRLAIRQRTRVLERWPKQALLMRGRFTAKMWKRSSVCPGCQKRSVAVDPPVRYSPWVTQAHICAYYAASDRCTMVAQPADNEVKK